MGKNFGYNTEEECDRFLFEYSRSSKGKDFFKIYVLIPIKIQNKSTIISWYTAKKYKKGTTLQGPFIYLNFSKAYPSPFSKYSSLVTNK